MEGYSKEFFNTYSTVLFTLTTLKNDGVNQAKQVLLFLFYLEMRFPFSLFPLSFFTSIVFFPSVLLHLLCANVYCESTSISKKGNAISQMCWTSTLLTVLTTITSHEMEE